MLKDICADNYSPSISKLLTSSFFKAFRTGVLTSLIDRERTVFVSLMVISKEYPLLCSSNCGIDEFGLGLRRLPSISGEKGAQTFLRKRVT